MALAPSCIPPPTSASKQTELWLNLMPPRPAPPSPLVPLLGSGPEVALCAPMG